MCIRDSRGGVRAGVCTQRAHHLPANGLVGNAEWRALGADTGTYTSPVPGFMGTLFAST